tara:strand:- start:204 stop:581 length:378 start_codon:yes stop_codon:yes gene_type:complete
MAGGGTATRKTLLRTMEKRACTADPIETKQRKQHLRFECVRLPQTTGIQHGEIKSKQRGKRNSGFHGGRPTHIYIAEDAHALRETEDNTKDRTSHGFEATTATGILPISANYRKNENQKADDAHM